jgi:dipeptidyl aminopeptidase/acylaminoacyl peptidase
VGKILHSLALLLLVQQPVTPPPATDIYELVFDGDLKTLTSAVPRPVSTAAGYDNQPSYTPDGTAILFTANRDGKQTDIYEFDRKTQRVRAITTTPEGEYSPTVTPDQKGISVIRVEADSTQRLWRFERDGSSPRLVLTDVKPVGYHVWIDEDQLALFVLGQPSTLQLARVSTGKATAVAERIGRSLHRIPGTMLVSFVHTETPESVWVKQFDARTGASTPLVRVAEGNSERDVAWLPDGTLLMSAGTKILAWRRGETASREVYDSAKHGMGTVTRMASSPDGKAIALVVNEPKR